MASVVRAQEEIDRLGEIYRKREEAYNIEREEAFHRIRTTPEREILIARIEQKKIELNALVNELRDLSPGIYPLKFSGKNVER